MDEVAIEAAVEPAASDIVGVVAGGGHPVGGVVVVATDEGAPIASTTTDAAGAFTLRGLPATGAVTIRAIDPTFGAATAVTPLPAGGPVDLGLSVGGCRMFQDLPDPHWLVTAPFLATWSAEALAPTCPTCPTYRWFWDRPGLTPVVLRLDFTPDGVWSTVRVPTDEGGWDEHRVALSARRGARLDRALGASGFWELEHWSAGGGCVPDGPQWTIEAVASPGYRAVFRVDPSGTPIAYLGKQWLRAVGLRVRRKDFR